MPSEVKALQEGVKLELNLIPLPESDPAPSRLASDSLSPRSSLRLEALSSLFTYGPKLWKEIFWQMSGAQMAVVPEGMPSQRTEEGCGTLKGAAESFIKSRSSLIVKPGDFWLSITDIYPT